MIPELCAVLRAKRPLVHCITNPISINQCANAVLAVGARPMMAEHPREVAQITRTAGALMLNLGNITDVRMESMAISAGTAREKGIPILLDAVGVACSDLRREYVFELLNNVTPTVIKGNYSEISALYRRDYRSSGVDADEALAPGPVGSAAAELARRHHTVILASGATDVITDGSRLVYVKNGTPQLSTVTGTGCMLGALCASYLSVKPDMDAAVTACGILGICGEYARIQQGSGSFLVNLMDALSRIGDEDIRNHLDMEEMTIEKL